MKILYYSTAYHASHGGSVHSRHFVSAARQNPRVTEIDVFPDRSSRDESPQVQASGFRKIVRSSSFLQILFFYRRNTFYFKALQLKIASFKPDVLMVRLDSNFLQLEKIRNKFPSLIIATEVNASPFDESFKNIAFRHLFRKMEREHLGRCHLNFFVSQTLRDSIMDSHINHDRDKVVQNGVDITLFKPANREQTLSESSASEKIIGYLGTLDHHKEVDRLLRAMAIVRLQHPHSRLLIVGDGPSRSELERLSMELGLQDVVRFAGACKHREVPDYLNMFDIAVHHRAGEYMSPIKLFEYLATKLPVIAPDTKAVREVFENGVDVLLTNGKPSDIAEKIDLLLRDELLRTQLAQRGFDKVVRNYTWEANASSILHQIEKKLKR